MAMARFNEKLSWFNNNFFNMFWFRNTWHVLKYSNKLIYEGEYWEKFRNWNLYFVFLRHRERCYGLFVWWPELFVPFLNAKIATCFFGDWYNEWLVWIHFLVTWQQWVIIDTTRKNWSTRSLGDPTDTNFNVDFSCFVQVHCDDIAFPHYHHQLSPELDRRAAGAVLGQAYSRSLVVSQSWRVNSTQQW